MNFIQQIVDFVNLNLAELKLFALIPIGVTLIVMFVVNAFLSKLDKSKVLELSPIRKSFEFLISFPVAFGVFCIVGLCLHVDIDYKALCLPGMLVYGLVTQLVYLVLGRTVFAIIKFVVGTILKAVRG